MQLLVFANKGSPSDTIIRLLVPETKGNLKQGILNVHLGMLCKSSLFFQRAVKPEWHGTEGALNSIPLADDVVGTVSDYIRWLYHGKIPINLHITGGDTREEKAEEMEKIHVLLAEAYVFGEKIMDVKYKNAVVEAMFAAKKVLDWSMGPESVSIAYEGTPSESPLRRLIAENIAHKAHDDSEKGIGWMQFFESYPREALVEALKTMVKVRTSRCGSCPGMESYLEEE
jgi:hypothetical protein